MVINALELFPELEEALLLLEEIPTLQQEYLAAEMKREEEEKNFQAIKQAEEFLDQAKNRLEELKFNDAEKMVRKALEAYPGLEEAMTLYNEIEDRREAHENDQKLFSEAEKKAKNSEKATKLIESAKKDMENKKFDRAIIRINRSMKYEETEAAVLLLGQAEALKLQQEQEKQASKTAEKQRKEALAQQKAEEKQQKATEKQQKIEEKQSQAVANEAATKADSYSEDIVTYTDTGLVFYNFQVRKASLFNRSTVILTLDMYNDSYYAKQISNGSFFLKKNNGPTIWPLESTIKAEDGGSFYLLPLLPGESASARLFFFVNEGDLSGYTLYLPLNNGGNIPLYDFY